MKPNQVIDRCASTNDLARLLGDRGEPHGTWISAREQEAGRGRLGRKWESGQGGLYLSMVCRLADKTRWSWVPLVTAIGTARALKKLHPALDVRVKWPNDLWIGQGASGAKLGGILCEAVGSREQSYIIVGLGLNCTEAPEGLDQKTISLAQAGFSGAMASVNSVRHAVIESLHQIYQELQTAGGPVFAVEYESMAALPMGAAIEWGDGKAGGVLGLGPSGELLVMDQAGRELKLFAEDVKVRVSRRGAGGSPV